MAEMVVTRGPIPQDPSPYRSTPSEIQSSVTETHVLCKSNRTLPSKLTDRQATAQQRSEMQKRANKE